MIGQTVAQYRIIEKIGAGGMGEVFLAEDTKLNRQVALKFLPEALRRNPEARERLLREARAASQLNHPNILTIHAVESVEGRDFIAMEYLDGATLDIYCKNKSPRLPEILSIGSGIAAGLDRAHRAGIVHRDLKPANIMVDAEGNPKILDFGVAKFAGATKLTQTGSTIGTMAYMSPEQAQRGDVDGRSDLFSLGVILYEMITGQAPFQGDHEAAVIYAIVNEEPEPLARYKSDVPAQLQSIISKCLAKDSGSRYQSAADLAADLRTLALTFSSGPRPAVPVRSSKFPAVAAAIVVAVLAVSAALIWRPFSDAPEEAATGRKMLAVLPFENLGSPDDEYFADGITDEITARLAGVAGLGVIARTSVIPYKGTDKTIQQIGQELGVGYILEGTIRWQKSSDAPDRVRITPQLIQVTDATHLWGDVYDEVLTEVFAVQSDVARKVVAALNITLMEPEQDALERKPTDNLEAYDYHLRGKQYWADVTRGTISKSVQLARQLYEKAIATDSTFALAYAQLSRIHTELYWHAGHIEENRVQARAMIDKAMLLDPNLTEVHIALGSLYYHEHDYDAALAEFAIAREQQPNNAEVLIETGYVYLRQADHLRALDLLRQAAQLDPRSPTIYTQIGGTLMTLRRYTEAEESYIHAVDLAPELEEPYTDRSLLLILRDGDVEKAMRVLREAERVVEITPYFHHIHAWMARLQGDYERALKAITVMEPTQPALHLHQTALILELLGETDSARTYYDSARIVAETIMVDGNDDAGTHSDFGIALAGLGRTDDAVRAGTVAIGLRPIAGQAATNFRRIVDLAWIHVKVGQYDAALDRLEEVLALPAWFSRQAVRLDPIWDPLRDLPRYQALMAQDEKVF